MMAEQEALDHALLKGLTNILHEQVLNEAIEQAIRHLRSHQDTRLDRAFSGQSMPFRPILNA